MENIKLQALKRGSEKAKTLRENGYIPGIMYGPGMKEDTVEVMVEYQTFRKAFRLAGESTVIELDLEGRNFPVLVHTFDRHPVTSDFEHIDFYVMNMEQEVHTHIQLHFEGTAPVVKEKNGVLVTSKETLEVKCLPKYLVHDITVDVSGLAEFHDHILVKDLPIPEGITVLDAPDDAVITATPPKKEVEEEVVAAEGAAVEGTEAGAEEAGDEKKE